MKTKQTRRTIPANTGVAPFKNNLTRPLPKKAVQQVLKEAGIK